MQWHFHRHSVLEDYGRSGEFTFYSNTDDFEPFPSTSKRLRFFKENALNLSYSAVQNMLGAASGIRFEEHYAPHCCVLQPACTRPVWTWTW